MRHLPTLFLLLSLGCGSLATSGIEYPEACGYYDTAYLAWSATAAAAGGLATASGTAAASVGGLLDGDDARDATIGLGIVGLVSGVLATVATLLSGEYADRFVTNCPPLAEP